MARALWQGIAVLMALLAWHVFVVDFATGALAAAVVFIVVSLFADHRHGTMASVGDARQEVLSHLQREEVHHR